MGMVLEADYELLRQFARASTLDGEQIEDEHLPVTANP
jgi:hypothetical protein